MNIFMILNQFYPVNEKGEIEEQRLRGGAEIQGLRLSQKLQDRVNITIVTQGNSIANTIHKLGNLKILHYYIPDFIQKKRMNSYKKRRKVSDLSKLNYINSEDNLYIEKRYSVSAFFSHLIELIQIVRRLYKHRKEIDIIYVPMVSFMGQIAAICSLLLKKKLIVNDATMDGLERMYNCFMPNQTRKLIIKRASFIALSQQIYDMYIRNGVEASKIEKIPNGIDIPDNKIERIQKKHCLFVGNLNQQPAKGIDVLLFAWENVIEVHKDAKLYVLGDHESDYKEYAKSLGLKDSVIFTGKTNPKEYYESCNVFTIPSRREGMSNALMEAMAYGMPIVATSISGNTDLIEGNDCGMLIKPNDVKELTSAIIKILSCSDSELHNMGKNSREAINRLCSFDAIAKQYENFFIQVNNS